MPNLNKSCEAGGRYEARDALDTSGWIGDVDHETLNRRQTVYNHNTNRTIAKIDLEVDNDNYEFHEGWLFLVVVGQEQVEPSIRAIF